jgi:hypothetical protein
MGKFLLDLIPSELLAIVKKLLYFDNPVELYILLVSALHFSIHDLVYCILFNEIKALSQ